MNGDSPHQPSRATRSLRAVSGINNIPRWSIEHPYIVIAFYVGVLLLAWLAMQAIDNPTLASIGFQVREKFGE